MTMTRLIWFFSPWSISPRGKEAAYHCIIWSNVPILPFPAPPRTKNSFIRNYHFIYYHIKSRSDGNGEVNQSNYPRLFSWISFRRKTSLGHLELKAMEVRVCYRVIAHSRIGGMIIPRSKRAPRIAVSEKGAVITHIQWTETNVQISFFWYIETNRLNMFELGKVWLII